MDFSEKYIRMCQKAKEIQKKWKGSGWDFVYVSRDKFLGLKQDSWRSSDYCIWLPRQDQLQKIITNKGYFRFSLIELFYHFANRNVDKYTSMEQLWLAFVMWHKYKKIWDNKKEEWIKKENNYL